MTTEPVPAKVRWAELLPRAADAGIALPGRVTSTLGRLEAATHAAAAIDVPDVPSEADLAEALLSGTGWSQAVADHDARHVEADRAARARAAISGLRSRLATRGLDGAARAAADELVTQAQQLAATTLDRAAEHLPALEPFAPTYDPATILQHGDDQQRQAAADLAALEAPFRLALELYAAVAWTAQPAGRPLLSPLKGPAVWSAPVDDHLQVPSQVPFAVLVAAAEVFRLAPLDQLPQLAPDRTRAALKRPTADGTSVAAAIVGNLPEGAFANDPAARERAAAEAAEGARVAAEVVARRNR